MTEMTKSQPMIYLDYQATTPCDPRVLEKMLPYFTEHYGNPHSRNHAIGWTAEKACEEARAQAADLISANPKEIVFTSGATESNNLALKGVMDFYGDEKNHIITCVTEHKCILDTCRHLEQKGFTVTYLPVRQNGLIDLNDLEKAITDKTALVSIMAVNNEIGVIQPLKKIGDLCRNKGVFFHTDAAQAAGKIDINVNEMNIDLLSISSHKLYGPKGVGALYVRRKPRVRVIAQMNGGGQERGMRSGTLSPALCAGFGEACAIAKKEMSRDNQKLKNFWNEMYTTLTKALPDVYLNGDKDQRFYGNLNLSFAYVEGESLLGHLSNIALSSGSACTSASLEPSYVLRALGVSVELAHTSLRIGFGRFTTQEEVTYTTQRIIEAVNRLRELSPLWEMVQEGIDITKIQWAGH
ncbi:MAG: IscS subfamily cysteine desulfurase [Alphaproteobacteria bacterium]|nr:IscS subfamily cysteine desulfurase [Alphaproteobacteria bacterium]NCQ66457.1 IscS subfamily cysteine desulfurase [Alphaproteobacteria bacterium]